MTARENTPAAPQVPEDPDADARALASTLRIRILRLCLDEALTNREIALRLGRNPATVLHHVRTLVDRGFLVAEPVRRGARGSREVPYRATRKSWSSPARPGQARVLVDAFLEEIGLLDDLDDSPMVRLGLRLDDAGYRELVDRLQEIFQEFADRPSDPTGVPRSLFFSLHDDLQRMRPEA
ncbi:ArsR/SmtB family transcription factor [Cellulomonas composti]|uniref:ArsR family transcriptional regulator n=1 Tax=Cellulomonas composti TaxID=266130 RepID=A0A511JA39_9CELL|nr:winged helix-turn-helix domain-containing protein [Cellulomonas composti]GEL94573.1 ArsR family transcriptional regulator [Cellulomonas composti]